MRFDHDLEPAAAERLVVALAHPSLDGAVAAFADELLREQRFFGTAAPKLPAAALCNLTTGGGTRLGMMVGGRLVGMARVDADGAAVIAVVQPLRGRGLGRELLQSTLRRAAAQGHDRVTFPSSWRSGAFIRLAESSGATVVDHGRGRLEVVFALRHLSYIA